jgi:hypothetical protein
MKKLTFAVVAVLALASSAYAQSWGPSASQYRSYAPQLNGGGSYGSNQLSQENTQ